MKKLLVFMVVFALVISSVPFALADDAASSENNAPEADSSSQASESYESSESSESSATDPTAASVTGLDTAYLSMSNNNSDGRWMYAWTWGQGEDRWVLAEGDGSYYRFSNLDVNVVFVCVDWYTTEASWNDNSVIKQTVDIQLDGINKLFEFSGENGEGKITGYLSPFDESEWGKNAPTQPSSYTDPTAPSSESQPTVPSAPTNPSSSDNVPGWDTDPTSPSSGSVIKPSSSEPSSFTNPSQHTQPSIVKPSETNPSDSAQSGKTIVEYDPLKNSSESIRLNLRTATVKCGKLITLKVYNKGSKKVKYSSNNKKVAKVSSAGKVSALKKGVAKITVKVGSKKLYFTIKITSSPKLSKSSVTVKKGRYKTLKIIGKCGSVSNTYYHTKKARISGKRTAAKFKVIGLKKGKTTLKVKVNCVVLKLKVKVK